MKLPRAAVDAFQDKIFSWWRHNRRDLPWRHTRDPYKVLVSEVMLQQTQVIRVLPKYEEFLYFFPDIASLALAKKAKVLKIWKGMGYNRRALYLHEAAQRIDRDYYGDFSQQEKELVTLPGVGTYTARALLVFAFKKHIAFVDTNICRVITHFFFHGRPQKPAVIQSVADQLLPKGKAWEWHHALMDYGALQLTRVRLRQAASDKRQVTSKKKKSFKESNRFFRGRIVDRLREEDVRKSELITEMGKKYKKPKKFIIRILNDLEQEGLITESQTGIMSLPE